MSRQYVFKKQYKRTLMNVFDALGYVVKRASSDAFPLPKRLLVVRWDHLGDVVCALPLLQNLVQMQPKPYIAVSVSPAAVPLLRDIPGIDEIIPFQAPWFSRSGAGSTGAVRSFVRLLKTKNFDTTLELRGDLRHHFMLAWAGIPYRAGYGVTGGGFLLSQTLPWTPDDHAVERNFRFMDLWPSSGKRISTPSLSWKPRLEELEWVTKQVGRERFVVIHPDAGTSAKQWPIERYKNFINVFSSKGILSVVVGMNRLMSRTLRDSGVPFVDLIGQTTLPQLVTLLHQSEGLVSTDSGPAHMAAALSKPVWVLWSGTSDPKQWRPMGSQVTLAQNHVPCEYCEQSQCPVTGHPCLENLSWETVERTFQPSFDKQL